MREFICGYTTIWKCAFESFWVALILLVAALFCIGLVYDYFKTKALAMLGKRLQKGLAEK